jgi:hypothetical protein
MSICTNLGRDLQSRLAAYAVCVVRCARLSALRAHQCTLAIADLGRDLPSRLAAYDGYMVLSARLRAQCAHQCAPAIADPHNFCILFQ